MKQLQTFWLMFFSMGSIFSSAQTAEQKVDKIVIEKIQREETVRVIILFKDQADVSLSKQIKGKSDKATYVYNVLKKTANGSQKEVANYLYRRGFTFTSYYLVNAIAFTADKESIEWLNQRDDVNAIIEDQSMPMERYFRDNDNIASLRSAEPTWGIRNIGADKIWEKGYRGQGVVIGGQDTGYAWDVSPLKEKYRGFMSDSAIDHNYNWHDAIRQQSPLNGDSLNPCGFDIKAPCDDNNHGTHTMGTMIGSDTNVVIGVAPDAKWIGCRNMERGWGAPSTYLECFEWFLAPTDLDGLNPDPTKGPHVINNSWSCPEVEGCNPSNWALMQQAVINLKAAGTVVVVSAGNEGPGCGSIFTPAAIFEESFSIGAYAESNVIANFSSRGSISIDSSFRVKPNVSAPGVAVLSVIPNGNIVSFSGTSMAGPHVAGLVALLISANPNLAGEVELIENIIEQSSTPTTAEKSCFGIESFAVPNTTYGYGRINGEKALERALLSKVNQVEWENVQIFPNPNSGAFYIKGMDLDEISVFDVSGRLILSKNTTSNFIDLGDIQTGMYFIQLKGQDGVVTKPIIIN